MQRVFHSGRKSDHEITHMGLNGNDPADLHPIFNGFKHGSGFRGDVVSVFLWQSHAAVQADTCSIDSMPGLPRGVVQSGHRIGGCFP